MTPPSPNSFDLPPGTVLETDEDIRRVQAEIHERAKATNHRAARLLVGAGTRHQCGRRVIEHGIHLFFG